MSDIIVIGGGPAGIMSAVGCAQGNNVILLEKNEKLGKKLYITGKGRCNITNLIPNNDFLDNVVNNKRFLYSAINHFSPYDTVELLNNLGLETKVERGNRVFPQSDKSSDVIKVLNKYLVDSGAKIMYGVTVKDVYKDDDKFVVVTNNKKLMCDKLVIATGGKSYTSTGSTGDGYILARKFGHKIVEPKPALVGINLKIDSTMAGVSLKNVRASILSNDNKVIAEEFGEMLFTHTGVGGPIILTLSSKINRLILDGYKMSIDLKPALSYEQLDARLLRDFEENKNKDFKNFVHTLIPSGIIQEYLGRVKLADKKINEITKSDRDKIIYNLKHFDFFIKGLEDLEYAVVTSGGVAVDEINASTMESKLVKGLYFAGEVIDVDALTGGFNIQIALSTGFLVGKSIGR